MFKPFPLFIGIRYAGAKRQSQLVSFISLMSVMGMALGVALLILVLSVMNGFDREMRTRILGLVPHITITPYAYEGDVSTVDVNRSNKEIREYVESHSGVQAVAPFTQLNAMLLHGTDVEGVMVYGIDPVQESDVSIIGNYIDAHALEQLKNDSKDIIMGSALAAQLGIEISDSVNLMVTNELPNGGVKPVFARFTLTAIFTTGTKIDHSAALIAINSSLKLMPADKQIQNLRVTVNDTFQAPQISWDLNQNTPYGFRSTDWTRTYGNIYSAIQLSKQLVGLMLLTIIAVAAFNVVSALVMVVNDKRGDIAILRTAGASASDIMGIFIVQGTLIALLGTLSGALIGVVLSLGVTDIVAFVENIFDFRFLNSDVYPVDYLPSDLRIMDLVLVCSVAFVMSILATIYPAWRASRVQPAAALRDE
jgi:lipoprotein-releasing system permease protein